MFIASPPSPALPLGSAHASGAPLSTPNRAQHVEVPVESPYSKGLFTLIEELT